MSIAQEKQPKKRWKIGSTSNRRRTRPQVALLKRAEAIRQAQSYFGEGAGARPPLPKMVQLGHSRWRVEQDYRELKDELGLDHFEGRHWPGFHHHVTLVSIDFAFLRSEQLRSKKASHPTLPTVRRWL